MMAFNNLGYLTDFLKNLFMGTVAGKVYLYADKCTGHIAHAFGIQQQCEPLIIPASRIRAMR
jgi:hypothetical protein